MIRRYSLQERVFMGGKKVSMVGDMKNGKYVLYEDYKKENEIVKEPIDPLEVIAKDCRQQSDFKKEAENILEKRSIKKRFEGGDKMIYVLLKHNMELCQGDEFFKAEENRWKEVFLFPHDKVKNVYSEKTNIPVRRLIKTHAEFEAFWQEAIENEDTRYYNR